MRMHNPPHPGAVLKDALESTPIGVSAFAEKLGVSRVQLSRILNERAGITAEMSIRLSEAFGQESPDLWFKMQNEYDFWQAEQVMNALKAHGIKPVSRVNATAASVIRIKRALKSHETAGKTPKVSTAR